MCAGSKGVKESWESGADQAQQELSHQSPIDAVTYDDSSSDHVGKSDEQSACKVLSL